MKLLEYLIEKDIATERFAIDLGIPSSTMFNYLSNRRRPSEKVAKVIEKATGGRVTVKDLRGDAAGKELRGGWRVRKRKKT